MGKWRVGRGERRTEVKNRPAWMGLACRRKGESDMGEGRGVCGPGGFGKNGPRRPQ